MYRVLIVDDEPLVRRGIRSCVNWNELGIEMVAEAANGAEALAQMLSDRPDIILLDINMPRMDGLEFAGIVKKRYPGTRVVVITGYPDFEYVRSALRIGVDDYILKPVTKEEIETIVTAQLAELGRSSANALFVQARAREDELNRLLRREQRALEKVSAVVSGRELLPGDPVSFVLIGEYLSCAVPWAGTEELAQFAILNVADEIVGRLEAGTVFRTYKNEMAILLTCPEKQVESVLAEVRNGVADFLEIPVDFGISSRGPCMHLGRLADEAREAAGCSFVVQDSPFLFYEQLMTLREEGTFYPEQEERELLEHMLTEPPDEMNVRLDRFFDRLKQAVPNVQRARMYLLRLLLKLANAAESLAAWTGEGEPFFGSEDCAERVDSFSSLTEASDWCKKCYRETYEYVRGIHTRSGQLYMSIRSYIERNYASSALNLKKCSEDLYLSPNYISMILKKESGSTFVDFLNDYRIHKAARLLQTPGTRIADVAEQVGFTHPTYFSSVFKKVMGMTPKQYREQTDS